MYRYTNKAGNHRKKVLRPVEQSDGRSVKKTTTPKQNKKKLPGGSVVSLGSQRVKPGQQHHPQEADHLEPQRRVPRVQGPGLALVPSSIHPFIHSSLMSSPAPHSLDFLPGLCPRPTTPCCPLSACVQGSGLSPLNPWVTSWPVPQPFGPSIFRQCQHLCPSLSSLFRLQTGIFNLIYLKGELKRQATNKAPEPPQKLLRLSRKCAQGSPLV